jgi:hypothetical protein
MRPRGGRYAASGDRPRHPAATTTAATTGDDPHRRADQQKYRKAHATLTTPLQSARLLNQRLELIHRVAG